MSKYYKTTNWFRQDGPIGARLQVWVRVRVMVRFRQSHDLAVGPILAHPASVLVAGCVSMVPVGWANRSEAPGLG